MADMDVVARCEKCGREFFWVPNKPDLRDTFLNLKIWQETPAKERDTVPVCNGRIVKLETQN